MKPTPVLAAWLLACFSVAAACKDNQKSTTPTQTATPALSGNAAIPEIDIASLNNEAAILDAMQKVVDARMADEKKQKEDPQYAGQYLELTKLYTAVLKTSTEFANTINDPKRAIEFHNKINAIQDKMYSKAQ
ncbi:MAG: hypothetical protein JNM88_07400 [Chitinophagaceae bacterium]|nr:hypothetical protein [Chitinophagaceae bacterium]